MKKLPLILMGILCFATVMTYFNVNATKIPKTSFKEELTGTVSQGSTMNYYGWIQMRFVVTGTGTGDLPGSPIMFRLLVYLSRRGDQRSFIYGMWTFMSDSSKISGFFIGMGDANGDFSGWFMTYPARTGTGIYSHEMIMGCFECKFSHLQPYGAPLGYEASWSGAITQVDHKC
jgi:hypothetical protein